MAGHKHATGFLKVAGFLVVVIAVLYFLFGSSGKGTTWVTIINAFLSWICGRLGMSTPFQIPT
jgi:hypothetical protein